MQTRDRIHRLLDDLPEAELSAVEQFLAQRRAAADPLLRALADAPTDDEPITPEEETAVAEAYADIAAGRVVSHEEVRQRLLDRL